MCCLEAGVRGSPSTFRRQKPLSLRNRLDQLRWRYLTGQHRSDARSKIRCGKQSIPALHLHRSLRLGAIHALVLSFLCSGPAFSKGFESLAIARSLATSGRFADPYMSLATGATAHVAPLYVLLLASLIWTVGDARAMALVILLNAVLFGALLSLLPHLLHSSPNARLPVCPPLWERFLFRVS